jgi:3-hydroxyisobutyrate dehydrogenase-like beta-hydroxyacid dehydrogenase
MQFKTVAILSPGDMGHAVGRVLGQSGRQVITCLEGRSARSRTLAEAGGFELSPTLVDMVRDADIVLSILPPDAAMATAQAVAAAMGEAGATPVYADCNAISPDTTKAIGKVIEAAGAIYIDAGIIGPAPSNADNPTRFYVSGPAADAFQELDGHGIGVRVLNDQIGQASAMKMCFAAITKGSWTLYTAALVTAESFGLTEAYMAELSGSRPNVLSDMQRMVPRLPVDAGRWIGEMEEIAATFKSAGLPAGFHDGAADVFRLLDKTPIAQETRETIDKSRTLEQCLAIYTDALSKAGD